MNIIKILSTTPSVEVAQDIADRLLREHLIACAQVSGPIKSTYTWNGEIHHDEEYELTLKTTEEKYVEVESLIKKLHPYDVPQIVAMPVAFASEEYRDWILKSVH